MAHKRGHRTRRKRGGVAPGYEPVEATFARMDARKAEDTKKSDAAFETEWTSVSFAGKDQTETENLAAVKTLFKALHDQVTLNPNPLKTVVIDTQVADQADRFLRPLLIEQKSAKTFMDKFKGDGGLPTEETIQYLNKLALHGEWKGVGGGLVIRFYEKLMKVLMKEKEKRAPVGARRKPRKTRRYTRRR